MSKQHVSTVINGNSVEFLCEPQQTLLDVLRNDLNLTGTKEGCGTGDCGACSITMDDRLVCSCLVLGVEASGKKIETIEGMSSGDGLHVLQQKFLEHAALQCGICTPGILVADPRLSWRAILIRLKKMCVSGSLGIFVAARDTTRLLRQCWMQHV